MQPFYVYWTSEYRKSYMYVGTPLNNVYNYSEYFDATYVRKLSFCHI